MRTPASLPLLRKGMTLTDPPSLTGVFSELGVFFTFFGTKSTAYYLDWVYVTNFKVLIRVIAQFIFSLIDVQIIIEF